MRSRIEKFIADNREKFDAEEPSPLLWQQINSQLENKQSSQRRLVPIFRYAAAAVLIGLLVTTTYFLFVRKENGLGVAANQHQNNGNEKIMEEINPAYAKEVYHFTQLIELKQNELEKIRKAEPELYKQFLGDISKLDSSYNALQKQLPQNPNREQLLEAMIQNLRLQTELLNQQLIIIQKIKNTKSNSDENSNGI